jgi:uridylate kinase
VTAESRYRRIVLKVSGESLSSPGAPLDSVRFGEVGQSIAELWDMGIATTVVVGGGNIFRGGRAATFNLDRVTADKIGMIATGVNAQLLAGALSTKSVPHQIFSRGAATGIGVPYDTTQLRKLLADGQVAILAGGSGEPGHSTDLPAVQAAIDACADVVVMSKHGIDCVFDADPKETPDARPLAELTVSDALRWNLGVMDSAALALARENGKLIHVVPASDPNSVRYAIEGKQIGSVIYPL